VDAKWLSITGRLLAFCLSPCNAQPIYQGYQAQASNFVQGEQPSGQQQVWQTLNRTEEPEAAESGGTCDACLCGSLTRFLPYPHRLGQGQGSFVLARFRQHIAGCRSLLPVTTLVCHPI
jgi:hypothetical protein